MRQLFYLPLIVYLSLSRAQPPPACPPGPCGWVSSPSSSPPSSPTYITDTAQVAAAVSLAAVRHAAPKPSSSAQTPLALASAARTRRRTWTVRAASLEPRTSVTACAARGTALSVAPARARRPGARLSGALGQPVRQIWTAATVEPVCSARTASSLGLFRVCRGVAS
jgi:hypothetical protein